MPSPAPTPALGRAVVNNLFHGTKYSLIPHCIELVEPKEKGTSGTLYKEGDCHTAANDSDGLTHEPETMTNENGKTMNRKMTLKIKS